MLRAARDLSLLGFAAGIRSTRLAETPAHEACVWTEPKIRSGVQLWPHCPVWEELRVRGYEGKPRTGRC